MSLKFNPFTGTLDLTGSSGASSGIDIQYETAELGFATVLNFTGSGVFPSVLAGVATIAITNHNLDGGFSSSVYLASQEFDGGNA